MSKIAVVLMNLGGPDSLNAVRPFLYNLFKDPAIIQLPFGIRHALAWLIAKRRTSKAQGIYEKIGGKSPLLENTLAQMVTLEAELSKKTDTYRVFIAMRYWHPFTNETVQSVADFNPDEIILLPLYPQFSTTTSASSVDEWYHQAQGLKVPTTVVGCYPTHDGFLTAYQDLIKPTLEKWKSEFKNVTPRLLFSAHGLPQKIVDAGDPYPNHVRQSVEAIMKNFGDADYAICYQSKVGPLQWLAPSLDDEMERAAKDGVGVIVVPVSFVSEHSETLVELDIDYKLMAKNLGIPYYDRVSTVGCHPKFMEALADLVTRAHTPQKCCEKCVCVERAA